MTPTTLSQVNCQKHGILTLLDGVKHCFKSGQKGINIFLQGRTGTGKTTIAQCLAHDLGATNLTIEQKGAKAIELDTIRRWNESIHQGSMFGQSVIIIDEAQHLTKDQMSLLLAVLDNNKKYGKFIIILTSMFDDDEITGARTNEWKPLKDRCIIPPMGDVEDADFQNEIAALVKRTIVDGKCKGKPAITAEEFLQLIDS